MADSVLLRARPRNRPHLSFFTAPRLEAVREPAALPARDPQPHYPERRTFPRVRGREAQVVVARVADRPLLILGRVWDRSWGGLGVRVAEPVGPGEVVHVRPITLWGKSEWVRLEVRNCRRHRDGWVIDCRFLHTPDPETVRRFC